ncbi:LysR substrate-binding domain-containing protein [Citreimonas sp.]|uniref:LysR substrate-binding domain-containing protein n=1 Tax=Citreimonas sp. TaxID=3036715 RepID=UPI0035C85A27
MTALVCFEAAARKLSFKQAAAELNVTPAAVSHQIRALESELGRTLFRRQHRGVDLTETGAYLFVALRRGFEGISEAVSDVKGNSDSDDVVIHATTAMSAFWLTPQIADFWKSHPEVDVSQVVSDSGAPEAPVALSIHYGPVPDDDAEHHSLFRDRILAAGTPAFAARHAIDGIEALRRAPLVHVTAEAPSWTGWADWFAALGLGPPVGRRIAVNNYMIALQIAQDGAGAVLGWDGLIGSHLESGALVELVPQRVPSPHGFYLKIHPRASDKARLFSAWLVAAQGRTRQL